MAHRENWYENAVIYALDVESFIDANGDGIGDFTGLTNRLDYLAGLGVTCLWLLPCYPTPNRDNGYDVSDYYGIDPRLGTLGDYAEFLREAESRGIRVLMDLVVQHTSDKHPWFKAARADRGSPYRSYYIWRDEPPDNPQHDQIVYLASEQSTAPWTYLDDAGAWYLHHFYDFEPDLNIDNIAVRHEIEQMLTYWLQLGVDGFRIDAAPYLGTTDASPDAAHSVTHDILRDLRSVVVANRGTAVLLGEVDARPDQLADYFGGGHELQMLFNFYLNNYLFLALASQEAEAIVRAFETLPSVPDGGQWVNWVRNYDELDLERLSTHEREIVYRQFAPRKDMRIYDRGIRRRLPPMVNGDQRCIRLAYSLMFSLPGTPCLFMGEEIGMGEDLALPGRNSVRTPMQWSAGPNGGFSRADSERLIRPVIDSGHFGYKKVNVADQRTNPESLLNWMRTLIWVRRETPEIGSGTCTFLEIDNPAVLVHRFEHDGRNVLIVHNLSGATVEVTLDLGHLADAGFITILSSSTVESPKRGKSLELEPWGYRWYRIGDTLR